MTGLRVFAFEEVGDDLPRPPLAAMRFFVAAGLVVSLRGWRQLPLDVRRAIVSAGARDQIDRDVARMLTNEIPPSDIVLTQPRDASPTQPSPEVALLLGGELGVHAWSDLRPFDRFVLNMLGPNHRLLWRALSEILEAQPPSALKAPLARAEVRLEASGTVAEDIMRLLFRGLVLEGRGLLLARAAGRRAARAVGELLDLHAETATGVVELEWLVQPSSNQVLWQAHASTVDGRFFPAASLLAATVAATALCDMLKEFDPAVGIHRARIVEEEWVAGGIDREDATVILE